jgi:hypothetical protein
LRQKGAVTPPFFILGRPASRFFLLFLNAIFDTSRRDANHKEVMMNFGGSIKTCFTKYADFGGRATRSEYWWWALFTFVGYVCAAVIDDRLYAAFAIATLLPSIAVTARRLHDVGRSGWWQLLYFLPLVGAIVLLVWTVQDSKPDSRF